MKIVLGIGNPGSEYVGTRHNCGFRVVELVARRAGVRLRSDRQAWTVRTRLDGVPTFLVLPETYVNRTGEIVPRLLREQEADPSDLLVVCDDLHLPAGALRVRAKGSAGGHHGLESIIAHLGGARDFPRLRIGIGEPGGADAADYVLTPFEPAVRPLMEAAFARAADAVACWAREGIEACMNAFNAAGDDRATGEQKPL
jgi:PTH1 family peptidyl-tRNA hydrolase